MYQLIFIVSVSFSEAPHGSSVQVITVMVFPTPVIVVPLFPLGLCEPIQACEVANICGHEGLILAGQP